MHEIQLGARAPELVEQQYRDATWKLKHPDPVLSERANAHNERRYSGVRDALGWVLGYRDSAPISGRFAPKPTDKEVVDDWLRGRDANEQHRGINGRDFTYCSAVEHALAWVRGLDTDEPAGD